MDDFVSVFDNYAVVVGDPVVFFKYFSTINATADIDLRRTLFLFLDYDYAKYPSLGRDIWQSSNMKPSLLIFVPSENPQYQSDGQELLPELTARSPETMFLLFRDNSSNGPGLVGRWKFNEGSGDTAYDSSKEGNNGTIYGASWVDGKALSFDGVDDYVFISNPAGLQITNALTIEAWIKSSSSTGWMGIADKGATSDGKGYGLAVTSPVDGSLASMQVYSTITGWESSKGTSNVVDGNWHYLTGTFDGKKVKIYIDGNLENEADLNGTIMYDADYDFVIGADSRASESFNGIIDEVRIYNRALTADEIYNNYLQEKLISKSYDNFSQWIPADSFVKVYISRGLLEDKATYVEMRRDNETSFLKNLSVYQEMGPLVIKVTPKETQQRCFAPMNISLDPVTPKSMDFRAQVSITTPQSCSGDIQIPIFASFSYNSGWKLMVNAIENGTVQSITHSKAFIYGNLFMIDVAAKPDSVVTLNIEIYYDQSMIVLYQLGQIPILLFCAVTLVINLYPSFIRFQKRIARARS